MKSKLITSVLIIISIIFIGSSVWAVDDTTLDLDRLRDSLSDLDNMMIVIDIIQDILDNMEDESEVDDPSSDLDLGGMIFDDEFSLTDPMRRLPFPRFSARVIEVGEIITRESMIFFDQTETVQFLVVEMLEGERKGEQIETTHFLAGDQEKSMGFDVLRVGDRVYVTLNEWSGEPITAYVELIQRQNGLLILIAIFIILILVVGRIKGIQTLISLVVTLGIIFMYTLPALFRGNNPIFISIISCIGVTIISFLVISGFRKKTTVAIIGTVSGFTIAGIIAIVFAAVTRMSGFNEDTMQLAFMPQGTSYNLVGLLFAGIIIGALGVCMDVAMSIASALWELKRESRNISKKSLFTAGMNIGKDAMATMSSTLILAYVGGLITIIILVMGYNVQFSHFVNSEMIAGEIIKGVTGSIGLITVIPITSYVAALLYSEEKKVKNEDMTLKEAE